MCCSPWGCKESATTELNFRECKIKRRCSDQQCVKSVLIEVSYRGTLNPNLKGPCEDELRNKLNAQVSESHLKVYREK